MTILCRLAKLFKGRRTVIYNVQEKSLSGAERATKAPNDPYGFVTFTVFLLGIGSLLPWNFFITATDYWNYKFRNPDLPKNSTETTALQKSFSSYLAIASKLPFILFLVVNTMIVEKIRCALRIGYCLAGCIILFIVTATLVKVNTDHYQKEFLAATLITVVLINVAGGFLQGGGTGMAGTFPAKYMTVNVLGQAVGGVFATLCQLACLLHDTSPTDAAFLYFSIATVVLVFTLMCFLLLVNMKFYDYYINGDSVASPSSSEPKVQSKPSTPLWTIFKSGWKFHVSTISIFWVTLAVFPAVTALIRSSNADSGSALTTTLFVPLACFVTFNFTDLFGRLLARFLPISSTNANWLLMMAVGRVVFVPLLIVCNVAPTSRVLTNVIFQHDWQYIIIMVLFGLSNGYITTLALTYASKCCAEEYQEVAGSLAALFLGLGLALGSVTSYLTIQLL
ncbi:equilibrative nucleoside transporter 1-like isoform X2 [Varroa destructor]|uniref:Equilibrative nucleoside transporter 1 n=1 Tax=Varroa destructor TaxID=109461 RepID=A0A7M7L831_VARDE|nr:equilibrative nucleoside transporter 1-like isoform X2 [Varroa destructor]